MDTFAKGTIKRQMRNLPGETFGFGLIVKVVLLFQLFGSGFVLNVLAETNDLTSGEYKIKAVYLFNFLKFTEWTEVKFLGLGDTIRITILGEDPFGDAFESLEGRTIKGKILQITQISSIQNLEPCHLLYISNSEKDYLEQVFKFVDNSKMLTVGETELFTQLGGIIGFLIEDNTVQFVINLSAADRAGIKFSSQLLQIARIIR